MPRIVHDGGGASCEGLSGEVASRTFLSGSVRAWQAREVAASVTAARDVVVSAAAVAAVRGRVLRGYPTLTTGDAVVTFAGERPWVGDPAGELAPFDPLERVFHGFPIELAVADAWVFPVRHWVELLWANLLALGPFLWSELVGPGALGVVRLGWASMRALSTQPEDIGAKLNRSGLGARVHRTATVEGCWLGDGARVGAGAVVCGAVLGAGAVVEELAMVEGTVLGEGARVQRLAMAKYSVIEAGASFGGMMQLGVIGADTAVKHGATLMDMAFGQGVRVRVGGDLRAAPHGLCGVCVGDGATVASGVRIAPGRAIPPGLELLADPGQVLRNLDLPEGCRRAEVRDGRLVAR